MSESTSSLTAPAGQAQGTGARIERFNFTERGTHWTHSFAFLFLLLSGCFLYFPPLSELSGRLGIAHLTVLNLHVLAGAFYIGGPLVWWLFGDRASLGRDLHALDVWDDDDLRFLATPSAIVKDGIAPPQGRFNAGQKVNTILLFASAVGFGVTGLIMWQSAALKLPQQFVQGSVNVHDILTLLTTALVAGHIYLAALHPTTRPGLSGILDGTVDRAWARHHHPKWVAEQERLEAAAMTTAPATAPAARDGHDEQPDPGLHSDGDQDQDQDQDQDSVRGLWRAAAPRRGPGKRG